MSASKTPSSSKPSPQHLPYRQRKNDQRIQKQILAAGDDDIGYIATSMLHCSLSSLFGTGKYSDLTVTCGNHEFQVHRAIVCPQSSFFDGACRGSFKESCTNRIDLPEDDPAMLRRLFQFLYTGNYSDGEYFDEMPSIPATMGVDELREDEEYIDTDEDKATQSISIMDYKCEETIEEDENDEDYQPEPSEPDSEPLEYDSNEPDCPISEEETSDDSDTFRYDAWDSLFEKQREPDADYPISLFTSLRMYVLADKYNVPALHYLAGLRFRRTAEMHGRMYPQFAEVVDELFCTTLAGDPLQYWVCQLIAPYLKPKGRMEERLKPIMAKHLLLSCGILGRMAHYAATEQMEKNLASSATADESVS